LELPLDHFRLIGVSPSASSEEILRAFQLRLDKTPNEGFTYEVLTQRAELLRLTADLLTNAENRNEYEKLVLNGAAGLEFSSNREVAGLILLWESGKPKEAFKLARKSLQPPQAPALGSGREADLTLLAALTARDAANNEQDQRCYVNASDFLQEGIHILQRMGKLNDLRKNLEEYLNSLLPFKILDLLSRDLSDKESHKRGVNMLENLIFKRGGLEGKNKSEYDKFLNQNEFEVFFQQIKPFLTAQEQVELFQHLYRRGSADSGYLAFLAVTAIGFHQRKPEKLMEAKKLLKNQNITGLDIKPLLGCIDMLLADVKEAEEKFNSTTDENLKSWLGDYKGERLEAICLYCKNWLENDVLKGYRDIEVETVDLDLWFEHKEIQSFIEKRDNNSNKNISKAALKRFGRNFQNIKNLISDEIDEFDQIEKNNESFSCNLPLPGGIKNNQFSLNKNSFSRKIYLKNKSIDCYNFLVEKYAELRFFLREILKNYKYMNKFYLNIYLKTFSILFIFGLVLGFLRNNFNNNLIDENSSTLIKKSSDKLSLTQEDNSNSQLLDSDLELSNNFDNNNKSLQIKEVASSSLSIDQVKYILNLWLNGKSQYLSGGEQIDLSKIVKNKLISRLNQERNRDIKKDIIKDISTEILRIKFLSQSSARVVVETEIRYSERILKNTGELISETNFNPFLKNKYIFGFSNKSWKLVDYVSGN
tara:strand:+ start:21 stop:2135 length:2115 start_codon:yes stop_codon:yes gene_type:complete